MIAVLAALCLLGTPAIQGKTLLQQVVPNPTGQNGYEEYLRAAQIVYEPDIGVYLMWQPGVGASRELPADHPEAAKRHELLKRLEKMTLLEVRREALNRYGEALVWVRQGNAKPVFDPRQDINSASLFPELAHFRSLAKLAGAAAYVHDADGNSAKATETLLDALTMSNNIEPSTIISYLVGVACQAIVLSSFQTRMDRLSTTDAERVADAVTRRLVQTPAVVGAMRVDARFMAGFLDDLQQTPPDVGIGSGGFAALSPAQRATVVRDVNSKLQAHYEGVLLRLQGPESEWVFEETATDRADYAATSPKEIAEFLLQQMVPVLGHVGTAAAKERTQMRLLRLAARVVAFRWEHERLPNTLEDAAPAAEIADPLTGDRFQYTPMSDRFRVYSKGVPVTGEIDIRYVRNLTDSNPPPPQSALRSTMR